jgi:hypothetical protein
MKRTALRTRSIGFATNALLASLGIASLASADALPGEQLKFFQSPLNGGGAGVYPLGAIPLTTDTPARFLGHDELSTATTFDGVNYTGTMMADDFVDTNPNPIGHITFWGSYMGGTDPGTANPGVQQFRISLYSDVPASGTTGNQIPSHPGNLIASQTVSLGALAPSSGTFTVKPVPPNGAGVSQPGDSILYQYNAELNWKTTTFPDAFFGNATTGDPVEWLSIVALTPAQAAGTPTLQWGWHDRDYGIADPYAPAGIETGYPYHLEDDAVSGSFVLTASGGVNSAGYSPQSYIPNYDGISSSKDLAFALYTVPEPSTLGLMIGAAAPLILARRRRRNV